MHEVSAPLPDIFTMPFCLYTETHTPSSHRSIAQLIFPLTIMSLSSLAMPFDWSTKMEEVVREMFELPNNAAVLKTYCLYTHKTPGLAHHLGNDSLGFLKRYFYPRGLTPCTPRRCESTDLLPISIRQVAGPGFALRLPEAALSNNFRSSGTEPVFSTSADQQSLDRSLVQAAGNWIIDRIPQTRSLRLTVRVGYPVQDLLQPLPGQQA